MCTDVALTAYQRQLSNTFSSWTGAREDGLADVQLLPRATYRRASSQEQRHVHDRLLAFVPSRSKNRFFDPIRSDGRHRRYAAAALSIWPLYSATVRIS